MNDATTARAVPATDRRRLVAAGNTMDYVITAADTAGAFSAVDFRVAPGFVAPPVLHRHTRETWWGHVLEGEVVLELEGGKVLRAPAGTVLHIPKGVAFRWHNPRNEPARWLLNWAPGGFEEYFVELTRAIAEHAPKGPAETAALARPLWAKYGLTTVEEKKP